MKKNHYLSPEVEIFDIKPANGVCDFIGMSDDEKIPDVKAERNEDAGNWDIWNRE